MELSFSYADCYWKYIQSYCPEHDNDLAAHLKKTIEATDWESPKAALDWNNLAQAMQIAFSNFINTLQPAHISNQETTPGLIYLPPSSVSKSSQYRTFQIFGS